MIAHNYIPLIFNLFPFQEFVHSLAPEYELPDHDSLNRVRDECDSSGESEGHYTGLDSHVPTSMSTSSTNHDGQIEIHMPALLQ